MKYLQPEVSIFRTKMLLCDRGARPTPEALRASPERSSGNQALLGWAYTDDRTK